MEGGMIAHALRLREGLPIYAPPSLEFVPFFYTPGYPIVLSALSSLTGEVSFALARCVSWVASLGVMWGIYTQVHQETKSVRYGLIGVGLFAAMFRTSGAFYDLARPDSLMLLFLTGSILGGRRSRSWRGVTLTASLMTLAFFTKQTSAVFFPVIAGWMFWENRARGLMFSLLTLGLCSLGVMWFNHETDGAFWSYIFEGHQGHVFYWKNILLKYWRDLIFLAPLTLLLPLLWFSRFSPIKLLPLALALHWLTAFGQRLFSLDYRPHMYYRELWYEHPRALILIPPIVMVGTMILSAQWGRSKEALKTSPYWLWIFIAGTGASGLNHSTQWAYSNCFMLIGLAFALAAPSMLRDLIDDARVTQRVHGKRALIALWGMVGVQMVAWFYLPSNQVIHSADLRAWGRLNTQLDKLPTPIFFPGHPTYNYLDRGMRGLHSIHTHQMGITDVAYRGGVSDIRQRLGRSAHKSHKSHSSLSEKATPYWSAVVTHDRVKLPYLDQGYYEAERWFYLEANSLRAKTGFLTRPSSLWLPRDLPFNARWHTSQKTEINMNFERPAQRPVIGLPSVDMIATMVHPHPEPDLKDTTLSWESLGWKTQGEAFGQGPECPRRWRGEGQCGAVSTRRARGHLMAELTLPPYGYISLLARGTRSGKSKSKSRLEIRLRTMNSRKSKTRQGVRKDGQWRRVILAPRWGQDVNPDMSLRVKLLIIDHAQDAQLYVDDLKIGVALDAP